MLNLIARTLGPEYAMYLGMMLDAEDEAQALEERACLPYGSLKPRDPDLRKRVCNRQRRARQELDALLARYAPEVPCTS